MAGEIQRNTTSDIGRPVNAFRQQAPVEVHVSDWDVVRVFGLIKVIHGLGPGHPRPDGALWPNTQNLRIYFDNRQLRLSSPVVNERGLDADLDEVLSMVLRRRISVASGKLYVLQGPRMDRHDLSGDSVIDPELHPLPKEQNR